MDIMFHCATTIREHDVYVPLGRALLFPPQCCNQVMVVDDAADFARLMSGVNKASGNLVKVGTSLHELLREAAGFPNAKKGLSHESGGVEQK